ncbi:MAG: hypothetical protein HC853_13890 [Anaerolineae bacterium]|nr:hypothetical protein [Anaerolineae bacterium]
MLDANHRIGQTFTAHHAGLSGIDVFLAPDAANASPITLTLRTHRHASEVLATAQMTARDVRTPAYQRFSFPPLINSRNADYFVQLEAGSGSRLLVGSAAGDAYMEGALYQNDEAQEAQLAFKLIYDRASVVQGWARQLLEWARVLLATFAIILIPGLALLSFWRGWQELNWLERLSLSCGIGLAFVPVLLMWANVFGFRFSSLSIAVLVGLSSVVLLVRLWRMRKDPASFPKPARPNSAQLCALIILALVIFTRFQVIGSLPFPMWGDSWHHTLIVQLMADHGGLFTSWQPYADLDTFTYHFGFHSFAAALHWAIGSPAPQATLWAGQAVNIMAVFALYALAIKLGGGNAWAGVIAMAVAGLLSPMPMFYVNWGRYTQLVGQVILCSVVYLLWWMAKARIQILGAALLLALVLVGLAISHYRVLLFGLVFAVVCVGGVLMAYVRARRNNSPTPFLRHLTLSALACVALAFVLFLPWLINIQGSFLASVFGTLVRTPARSIAVNTAAVNDFGSFDIYQDTAMWGLLIVCLVLGLVFRQRGVWAVGAWWLLIFVITNPHWLGLPGTGVVSNFASLIAIYIPTGLIVGIVIGTTIDRIMGMVRMRSRMLRPYVSIASTLLITAIGAQGVFARLGNVQTSTGVLITQPDLHAANWMRAHLPKSAFVLVNMFAAYAGTISVGTDGGWWLPLLAGARTTLPPATYSFEQPSRPDYREQVARFTTLATAPAQQMSQPTWAQSLKEAGITHIYVGQRQGRVNYGGPNLNPQQLLANPALHLIYHEDRVYLFEVR